MVTIDLIGGKFQAGDNIGGYRLIEKIGFGGEATVWSAWDGSVNRVVAIKIIKKDDYSSFRADGTPDLEFLLNLDHPNIRTVYDIGIFDEYIYLVTRYYPSGSLQGLVRSKPLSPEIVLKIAAQIISALCYLHQKGIVHRDLKPSNILLDVYNQAFLTDFGISKPMSSTTAVLHTGQGTPVYSSPEQYKMSEVFRRSDIYSLGIMLYELFTGTLPWGGFTALAIKQLDSKDNLPDPRNVVPSLPEGLVDVLHAMTAHEPEVRPATAREAWDLLANLFPEIIDNAFSVDQVIEIPPKGIDPNQVAFDEARKILLQIKTNWDPETEPIILSKTDFIFLDTVFAKDEKLIQKLSVSEIQLITRAAIVFDMRQGEWWGRLSEIEDRLVLAEQAIENDTEQSVERLLNLMLAQEEEITSAKVLAPRLCSYLIDKIVEFDDPAIRGKMVNLLINLSAKVDDWQTFGLSFKDDKMLASILVDGLHGTERISELLAKLRSKVAVQKIMDAINEGGYSNGLVSLVRIYEAAKSLPDVVPKRIKFQVWIELFKKQISSGSYSLIEVYAFSALGGAFMLSSHVFMSFRLPQLFDTTRILNSLGSGILFGPVIGLGIFLTRILINRIVLIKPWLVLIMSILFGAFVINFGYLGFHVLFLDAVPRGYFVILGSLLSAMGIGLGSYLFAAPYARMLFGALGSSVGMYVSWQMALRAEMTPMLFFNQNQNSESVILIIISSVLFGVLPYLNEVLFKRRKAIDQ